MPRRFLQLFKIRQERRSNSQAGRRRRHWHGGLDVPRGGTIALLRRVPITKNLEKGVAWLIVKQEKNGDLSAGDTEYPLLSHALATLALCEVYGKTKDHRIAQAAQKAIEFLENSQNPNTGGWGFRPQNDGTTSSVVWQSIALKSATAAGLKVNPVALANTQTWLQSVTQGHYQGLFSNTPQEKPTPTATATGLLCRLYLYDDRQSPSLYEATLHLLNNLPESEPEKRNASYEFIATLAMYNLFNPENVDFDTWYRRMRLIILNAQENDKMCAAGSWDSPPTDPASPAFQNGRLMTTAFSLLTLETYYRHLLLFQIVPHPLMDNDAIDKKEPAPTVKNIDHPTEDKILLAGLASKRFTTTKWKGSAREISF